LNTYASKQARSKKRGISFNILYEVDFDQLKDGVSWAFNWGADGYNSTLTDMAKESKIAYFPMFWDSVVVKLELNGLPLAGQWKSDAVSPVTGKYMCLPFLPPKFMDGRKICFSV
jgi:hypothetical protein